MVAFLVAWQPSITASGQLWLNVEPPSPVPDHEWIQGNGAEGLEVTRPLAAGLSIRGGDVPLGLHVVAKAAGASSVRLPLGSVEPVYGLDPCVLAGKVNHYPDHGRSTPQHQRRRSILPPEHISLPVRLPGQHLHPQLRRSSWDGSSGRAGRNA